MTQDIVTISIIDTDRFFALGLEMVLRDYFNNKGRMTSFLSPENSHRAHLLFQERAPYRSAQFCRHRSVDNQQLVFLIENMPHSLYPSSRWLACLSVSGTIKRHIQRETLIREIESALSRPHTSRSIDECPRCGQTLTPRELDILNALIFSMTAKSAAPLLNISTKTFSEHKRRIMEKLGFIRSVELYHWLQSGGLKNYIFASRNF
ncbi:helix-turn-helix transcriptional regulator [Serratia marcescens]|uniref:helix-turn-helix transcriptional regulator n=1 Tax=Serratia marcescens TaxID=615 RepID=UPI0039892819